MEVTLATEGSRPTISVCDPETGRSLTLNRLSLELFDWFIDRGWYCPSERLFRAKGPFQFGQLAEGGERQTIEWAGFLRSLAACDPSCPMAVKAQIQRATDFGTVRLWLTYEDGSEGPLLMAVKLVRMILDTQGRRELHLPSWRISEECKVTRWTRFAQGLQLYGVDGELLVQSGTWKPIRNAYDRTTFEVLELCDFRLFFHDTARLTLITQFADYPIVATVDSLYRRLSAVRDGGRVCFPVKQRMSGGYAAPDRQEHRVSFDLKWRFHFKPAMGGSEFIHNWLRVLHPLTSPRVAALPVGAFARRSFPVSEVKVVRQVQRRSEDGSGSEEIYFLKLCAQGENLMGQPVSIEASLQMSERTIIQVYSQPRILYKQTLPSGVQVYLEIDKESSVWSPVECPWKLH